MSHKRIKAARARKITIADGLMLLLVHNMLCVFWECARSAERFMSGKAERDAHFYGVVVFFLCVRSPTDRYIFDRMRASVNVCGRAMWLPQYHGSSFYLNVHIFMLSFGCIGVLRRNTQHRAVGMHNCLLSLDCFTMICEFSGMLSRALAWSFARFYRFWAAMRQESANCDVGAYAR